MTRCAQALQQDQNLPLAAAEFGAGIDMHNAQRYAFRPGLMERALAYFTKL